MKLLALTDLHGDEAALDSILDAAGAVDAVLLGGDITHFGSPDDAQRLVRRPEEGGRRVWAVAGNCDSAAIEQRLIDLGVSLHGRGVVFQGLGLHGLGAMPPWRVGMYQYTEAELAEFLRAGHAQVAGAARRVVLSHCPPHGCRLDRTMVVRHVGSTALAEFIHETRPHLVLTGHIHEARGIDELDGTPAVNCGAARSGYYVLAEVDLDGDVRVELKRA
jgi:uncharacterized protein